METKFRISGNVYILLICCIVAVLFSGCVNQQQTETTTTVEEKITTTEKIQETTAVQITTTTRIIPTTCSDSDGGRNYALKGEVVLPNGTIYVDYCYNDKILIEYACDLLEGTAVNCPTWTSNGTCVDGACIQSK